MGHKKIPMCKTVTTYDTFIHPVRLELQVGFSPILSLNTCENLYNCPEGNYSTVAYVIIIMALVLLGSQRDLSAVMKFNAFVT